MLKSFLFWGNGDWAQGNHLSCARKSSGASTDWARSRQDWQCFALLFLAQPRPSKKESFDSFSLSLFIHIEGKPYSLLLLHFALFLQLPIGVFIQIREGSIRGIGLINLRDIGTFALRQKLCINRQY